MKKEFDITSIIQNNVMQHKWCNTIEWWWWYNDNISHHLALYAPYELNLLGQDL